MKIIRALLLCVVLAGVPSCALMAPKGSVEYEAARYNSFKSVWMTTLALYDYHMDLRVAGKIDADEARDIDAAWNAFRVAYRISLANANGNETAFTPDNVRKLADDVLTLIYAAQ